MIKAYQKGEDLVKDIESFTAFKGFKVWWLGQSGFLIKYQGECLLFDPYLSDSLTLKYTKTEKPHNRMSELVIEPSFLDMINVVTSSHNHTDHLDKETLNAIFKVSPRAKFVIPKANMDFVIDRLKCDINFPIGLADGESLNFGKFKIIGMPAAHNELTLNKKGEHLFMSYMVQFGEYTVYHSGDTLWYHDLAERLSKFKIDIAFLPINGNKLERKVAGNLSAEEAAKLGKEVGVKCVIPHHYHMFEFNTENPENFVAFCQKYDTAYKVLEHGESYFYSIV
jgi:L-ascorbate metabolism protein UlaG (beta-lactamase superfamily)